MFGGRGSVVGLLLRCAGGPVRGDSGLCVCLSSLGTDRHSVGVLVESVRALLRGARLELGALVAGGKHKLVARSADLEHTFDARSHSLTVLSSLPEATVRASGEKAAQRTQFEWPESVRSNFCPGSVQSLAVLSSEEVSKDLPSLLKETLRTAPTCALSTVDSPLTVGRHSRTVRSSEAEATQLPLGENATQCTGALWPENLNGRMPGLKFHM